MNQNALIIAMLVGIFLGGIIFSKDMRYKFFSFLGKMGQGTQKRPDSLTKSNSIPTITGASICPTCNGNKVVKSRTGKLILCPTCDGEGKLI